MPVDAVTAYAEETLEDYSNQMEKRIEDLYHEAVFLFESEQEAEMAVLNMILNADNSSELTNESLSAVYHELDNERERLEESPVDEMDLAAAGVPRDEEGNPDYTTPAGKTHKAHESTVEDLDRHSEEIRRGQK